MEQMNNEFVDGKVQVTAKAGDGLLRRRRPVLNHRFLVVLTFILVAFLLRPLFGLFSKDESQDSLSEHLTYERRAQKILKENPLIGWWYPVVVT